MSLSRRGLLGLLASIPFVRHFVAGAPELPKPVNEFDARGFATHRVSSVSASTFPEELHATMLPFDGDYVDHRGWSEDGTRYEWRDGAWRCVRGPDVLDFTRAKDGTFHVSVKNANPPAGEA